MLEEKTENSSNQPTTPPGAVTDHQYGPPGNQRFFDKNNGGGGVRFGGNYSHHRPAHPSHGRGGGQRQWHDNRGPRPRGGAPSSSSFSIRPTNPSAWNNYQNKPVYNNNTNSSRPYYETASHQHSPSSGVATTDKEYRPWNDKDEFDNLLEVCLNPKRPPKLGVDYRAEMLSWVEKGCRNKPKVFDLFDSQGVLWLLKFHNSHSRLAAKEVLDSSIQFHTYDYHDFSPTSQAFVLKNKSDMKIKRPPTNPSTALRMIDMALNRPLSKANYHSHQRQNKELTVTTTTTVDQLTENLNAVKLTEGENVDKNVIGTKSEEGGGDVNVTEEQQDNKDETLLSTDKETNGLKENASLPPTVDAPKDETPVVETELNNSNENDVNKAEINLETKPLAEPIVEHPNPEEGGELMTSTVEQ